MEILPENSTGRNTAADTSQKIKPAKQRLQAGTCADCGIALIANPGDVLRCEPCTDKLCASAPGSGDFVMVPKSYIACEYWHKRFDEWMFETYTYAQHATECAAWDLKAVTPDVLDTLPVGMLQEMVNRQNHELLRVPSLSKRTRRHALMRDFLRDALAVAYGNQLMDALAIFYRERYRGGYPMDWHSPAVLAQFEYAFSLFLCWDERAADFEDSGLTVETIVEWRQFDAGKLEVQHG